ncbi:mucin-17-like [Penaeus chinensis]|uniref:mucin-17-like n=1 Tax=Penaeus chinensis TaxID=139456 RepID=UPI001FB61409|nr:mucin-17-like [Penaeus chinensis]
MGSSVPHDLQTKVIAHLNSVTKSLMGQVSGVPVGSGLSSGSSSVVVSGGVVTLTPPAPSSSTSSSLAPLAPPLVVTTVADSSTTLAGLPERCSGASGRDAPSGVLASRLSWMPRPRRAPSLWPPTSKPSLGSVAPPSSSFCTLDSPTDYSSMSLSTQLSSTPSSFGGPRLVTFSSRPHEGFLYSVSEASSAPYETTFPPNPSGREQSSSFTSEKGGPTFSSEASRGVCDHHAEVRLVSSEASGETCQRLDPFRPSPSVKISVSFSDSSKVETQRASSYLSLYSDPTTAAQVVRPTPTLPEGVALSNSRPDHAQGTPSLYTLRPDSSCSVQPPAVTSYRSSFVTAVSSSLSPSSTSVSSTPNASSTPIVSSTSAAPTSLSTSTASTVPSILYVSSTPSVLSGPGIPSSPSVPSKPGVSITPTAPAMPYHPANHSSLPTSTVQSTFSLPPCDPIHSIFPHILLVNHSSIHFMRSTNSSFGRLSSQPNAATSSSDPSPVVTVLLTPILRPHSHPLAVHPLPVPHHLPVQTVSRLHPERKKLLSVPCLYPVTNLPVPRHPHVPRSVVWQTPTISEDRAHAHLEEKQRALPPSPRGASLAAMASVVTAHLDILLYWGPRGR